MRNQIRTWFYKLIATSSCRFPLLPVRWKSFLLITSRPVMKKKQTFSLFPVLSRHEERNIQLGCTRDPSTQVVGLKYQHQTTIMLSSLLGCFEKSKPKLKWILHPPTKIFLRQLRVIGIHWVTEFEFLSFQLSFQIPSNRIHSSMY